MTPPENSPPDIPNDDSPQPLGQSIKQRVKSGSVWVIVGYVTGIIVQMGSIMVLTRLLFKDIFGLMAIVAVVVQALSLFSDMGVGLSVIQNKRGDDPRFLNTAWTVSILRGFVLWIIALPIAWVAAGFYDQNILKALIPVTALTAIIQGFWATSVHTAQRHLQLGRLTFLQVFAAASGSAAAIVWAWMDATIWALVAGALVNAIVYLSLTHLVLPGIRNRLCWDRDAARSLFTFGRWVLPNTIIGFTGNAVDRPMLLKLADEGTTGIYFIAFQSFQRANSLITRLGSTVLFPALSRRADLPRDELRRRLVRLRGRGLRLAAVGLAPIVVVADLVFEIMFPPDIETGAWILPILMAGLWGVILANTITPVLLAIGKPQYQLFGSVPRLIVVSIGCYFAYHVIGLHGFVAAVAIGPLVRYIGISIGLWRQGLHAVRQDLLHTLLFAALLAEGLAIRWALGLGTPLDRLLMN